MSLKKKLNAVLSANKKSDGIATGTTSGGEVCGYFDKIDGIAAIGWAADKSNLDEKIEIEIVANGVLVARAVADQFRADLVPAGIGDGRHGFSVSLPSSLYVNKLHDIDVRVVKTGASLDGSPRKFQGRSAAAENVRLEGGALVGEAVLTDITEVPLIIEAIENGQVVGSCLSENKGGAAIQFHISLPSVIFDGRPHAFMVRAREPAITIAELALITPYIFTPEAALLRYAREGLKPALSVAAGFRYESLAKKLEEFASSPVDEKLSQITRAHARLVRGFADNDKSFDPLHFPHHAKPDVSIVIPVHNKFSVTYHCLNSLLLAPNRATFEVIIVDDGSRDESSEIPALIQGIQYVRNDEAQGFIKACNRGAQLARGDYMVMLNNDTEVTAGWLDELLWPFAHFDKVGMTGAKLLYPDGTLQEAGGIVWNTGDPWNYGRQANPRDPRFNYARQVDYLSGACIMLPTPLWNELGGFDEHFVPAYFEDTDLAFRVRDKGLKTVYTPFAQIIHFEGISSGTSTSSGIKRFQEINRPKFKKRWVNACQHNGKVGADLELNKERNVRFRVLVLDAETPMPDKNAGSYAAIQEMRMLQQLGFKCTFVPTNMAWMGHYTENLQRMGIECLYSPFAGSIHEIIEKRGAEFDLIYITRYYVAQEYIDTIRQHAPKARIVMNNADLHFLRELRAGIQAGSREVIEKSVATREAELAVMRKVDLVLAYTEVEKAVIQSHNLDSTKVAICPWVTDVAKDIPGFEQRADIAFLGGFSHHPNLEAVEWFAARVMPLLRIELPNVKFRIYGSNAPKRLQILAEEDENIVLEGWVPTVDEVYGSCRVFVAPLQSGAGIKGKVISALAHGVPCVLSPLAVEGIPVGDGVDAIMASKPEEWVEAIKRLYLNKEKWQSVSICAAQLAERSYGFANGSAKMQEALQHVEIFAPFQNDALNSK